jgi:protein-tyrosine-phosphatase
MNWRRVIMKKVLFVCVENACRSQMAEAFFNKLVSRKAIAVSAGTKPSNMVNSKVIKVMKEIGVDMDKQKPKLLTQEIIENADKLITMGCEADFCPAPYLKTENWKIEDPSGKSIEKFREVRDKIRQKVEKLIEEMELV